MLRDELAPRLRSLGFKGSGQTYALPSDSHWAVLGFQKSAFSDARTVSFTVNASVVGREEWETARATSPRLPSRPPANTRFPPTIAPAGYWHGRIGLLMPGRLDRWWKVDAESDTADIAEAVVADIREFVIPAMRERMDKRDIASPS